jgi:hypothetical protein
MLVWVMTALIWGIIAATEFQRYAKTQGQALAVTRLLLLRN